MKLTAEPARRVDGRRLAPDEDAEQARDDRRDQEAADRLGHRHHAERGDQRGHRPHDQRGAHELADAVALRHDDAAAGAARHRERDQAGGEVADEGDHHRRVVGRKRLGDPVDRRGQQHREDQEADARRSFAGLPRVPPERSRGHSIVDHAVIDTTYSVHPATVHAMSRNSRCASAVYDFRVARCANFRRGRLTAAKGLADRRGPCGPGPGSARPAGPRAAAIGRTSIAPARPASAARIAPSRPVRWISTSRPPGARRRSPAAIQSASVRVAFAVGAVAAGVGGAGGVGGGGTAGWRARGRRPGGGARRAGGGGRRRGR